MHIGELHAASIVEVDGRAILGIKGTDGDVNVEIPADKAQALLETVGEVNYVYGDDDPPEDALIG